MKIPSRLPLHLVTVTQGQQEPRFQTHSTVSGFLPGLPLHSTAPPSTCLGKQLPPCPSCEPTKSLSGDQRRSTERCQRTRLHQRTLGQRENVQSFEKKKPQTPQGFGRFAAKPGIKGFSLGFCHWTRPADPKGCICSDRACAHHKSQV